jgi:hypothetical protein
MKKSDVDFLKKREKLKEEITRLKKEQPWLETSPLMESILEGAVLLETDKEKKKD